MVHWKGRGASALLGGVLLVGAGSVAHASGFDGGYVGGQIGGASYDADVDLDGVASLSGLSATGFSAGFFGGYGVASASGVYTGFELDVIGENADAAARIEGEGTASVEARHSIGGSLRVGGLVSDNVLLYGSLGYQHTEFRGRIRGAGVNNVSDTDDASGPRVGAGVEIQGDSGWFMRGEVTYTAYSSESYGDLEVDLGATRVNLGLGYRF
ncbi:membrane protein [Thioalkalivibrio versutus]|uniref:Membrane protein n=1 Tax=Thioalkalivibrio versutus TaxID=106634 RepID=A0A0G3G2C5_9GAMM|nr:outer membrane beta-barrel protein [Thioalkalivibrio versutus]AKJ95355.1 membrane protein [Thioalkalivibrio versutus]